MRSILIAIVLAACGGKTAPPDHAATSPRDTGLVAFEKVRSVLQHPRCQNCHPAGDAPLQGDDGHPHTQNVQRGPYGPHMPPGAATGWRMPPRDMKMVFVGKSPHDLCEGLKDPAHNGGRDAAALRTHLEDPLVAWGWHPGRGRAPIPMSRQDFLTAFETWSAAGAPCP
jgi:hypothetical protein